MPARIDEVTKELRGAANAVLADFPTAAAGLRAGSYEDPEAFEFLVHELMIATSGAFTVWAGAKALREAAGVA